VSRRSQGLSGFWGCTGCDGGVAGGADWSVFDSGFVGSVEARGVPAGLDCSIGAVLSKRLEVGFFSAKNPNVSDVTIKIIAIMEVSRVKKFPAPLLPKMVELEPPKTAPISAPLPVWSRTTKINPRQTIM
jgi:hypothetical protein